MKKRLAFSVIATSLLLACTDGPKDADYYYKHTDELEPLVKKCNEKLESAKTVEETKQLMDDEECLMVDLAKSAIKLGSMDKAKMQRADGQSSWKAKVHRKKSALWRWASFGASAKKQAESNKENKR